MIFPKENKHRLKGDDLPLGDFLQQWTAPLPDENIEAKTLHRARIAFQNQESTAPGCRPGFAWLRMFKSPIWMGGLVLGLVALGFLSGRWTADSATVDRKMLSELKTLFPGELEAVVIYPGQDLQLLLNTRQSGSPSQPILVEATQHGIKVKILTFSGNKVSVKGFSDIQDLEILSNEDGGVVFLRQDEVLNVPPMKTRQFRNGTSVKVQNL